MNSVRIESWRPMPLSVLSIRRFYLLLIYLFIYLSPGYYETHYAYLYWAGLEFIKVACLYFPSDGIKGVPHGNHLNPKIHLAEKQNNNKTPANGCADVLHPGSLVLLTEGLEAAASSQSS